MEHTVLLFLYFFLYFFLCFFRNDSDPFLAI